MLRIPFVLLLNLLSMIRWSLANIVYAIAGLFRKGRRYVEIELTGHYPFGQPRGLVRRLKSEPTFLELRRDIKTLARDEDVAGVVIKPGKAHLGAARAAEIMELLDSLRKYGKHVVAQADMLQTKDYVEASVADEILMSPAGRLYTWGPRFEQQFGAEALDRHGISAQFVHIGQYKEVANRFIRNDMSPAQRLMMQELREGIERRWLLRIAERRRTTPDAARRLFKLAPLDPRTAIREGLLDGEAFEEDLPFWLERRSEHAHEPSADETTDYYIMTFEDWRSARPKPFRWRPLIRRPRVIAVLDLSGFITMPGMQVPGASSVIDPDEVIPALRRLANSRRVAGVLLHINSLGGSALASDLMWKAIGDVRKKKPVVAYCTDVAASGGYYLAVAADRIVCHAETITGSIGVITGKLAGGEAAARFGINCESVDGGDGSEFLSIFEPMSDALKNNVIADTRAAYRRFLQRVGQARGLSKRRLHRYARGRVYLGEQALQRGLVDEVSGFEGAVKMLVRMCAEAGVHLGDDPKLAFVPHRKTSLKDALKKGAIEASGPFAQALEPIAFASILRQEPTLALMPLNIRF